MNEEKRVEELLIGPLSEKGYSLYSLKLSKTKEGPSLQIQVDRVDPISLDDIVELSGFVSDLLDKEDPISGAYTLDLSSAGAEKTIPLEGLPSYVGRYVHLHLSHPYKGENILEGTLKSVEGGNVTLAIRDKSKTKEILFPLADVDAARLAIQF